MERVKIYCQQFSFISFPCCYEVLVQEIFFLTVLWYELLGGGMVEGQWF